MNLTTDVRFHAADLAVGESRTGLRCPVCDGGRSHEHTFSVTRETDGVLFNCYRAKCPTSGFVGTSPSGLKPKRKDWKVLDYWGAVRLPTDEDIEYFANRFQLFSWDVEKFIRHSDDDEYVLPIYDLRGLEQGYVVRQPVWKGKPSCHRHGRETTSKGGPMPKTRVFPHVPKVMQSFYIPSVRRRKSLVVVEDQISAIKAYSAGYASVALLGVDINEDKIREWSLITRQSVIIALDYDATAVAFKAVRKWGLSFHSTRVVVLQQDLKDTELLAIPEILGD